MSRIGKQPIPVPSGVDVTIKGRTVTVKGKLGTLQQSLPDHIQVAQEDTNIVVTRQNDDNE